MAKAIRIDNFTYKGKVHTIRIQRTGNKMPQPARIVMVYEYWCDVGGVKGWETYVAYDRTFEDWSYAHGVYREILKRGGVTMKCPYCGNDAEYLSAQQFYGMDYKTNVYFCPPCDARVGTHKNSSKPLGTMANSHLRVKRQQCHALIDPYWKSGKYTRTEVYKRMAKAMGLTSTEAHIGMFDMGQCEQLIAFFTKRGWSNGD